MIIACGFHPFLYGCFWLLHPRTRVRGGRAVTGRRLEEILPVNLVHVNIVPLIPAAHDVVDGAGIINSQLARRNAKFLEMFRKKNCHND
jgi:hypothetical protein